MGKIKKYCEKHDISLEQFCAITGMSYPQVRTVDKDPKHNLTIASINKIYLGTKEAFGEGLRAEDYLDFEVLKKK